MGDISHTSQAVVGTPAPQSPAVEHANDVISGAGMMLCFVAALLFLRFYRKTKDRLFAFFAAAFAILGINGILFHVANDSIEGRTYLYAIRLVAYLVILYAIIDKNWLRAARSHRHSRVPPDRAPPTPPPLHS